MASEIRMAPKERVDKGDIQGMKQVGVIVKHASDTIQKYYQSVHSVPMPTKIYVSKLALGPRVHTPRVHNAPIGHCSARVAHRLPCAEAHERLPDERLLVCLCQLVLPQRERALQRVPEG